MTISQSELDALTKAITPTEELYFKGVLYGEFGLRKTTTALRCTKPGTRAVLLHVDRGWQAIQNHPDEFGERVIPIQYEGLSQVRSLIAAIVSNTPPFDNVSLISWDTVSQSQEEYIDFLLDATKYDRNYREKAVAKQGKKFEAQEIPGQQDYHLAKNQMRPVVRALVKAPIDVMFVAHVRDPGPIEKSEGKIERRPSVTESLYKVIARDSTFIGYCFKDKNKRYSIDFEPSNKLSAKSQIRSLQDKQILAEELPQYLSDWKVGN